MAETGTLCNFYTIYEICYLVAAKAGNVVNAADACRLDERW